MDTPLELHALREMHPLAAANMLTGCSRPELLALCSRLNVVPKRNADKYDLVTVILTVTHPRPAAPAAAPQYTQERFV